jgi:hypothetical protein
MTNSKSKFVEKLFEKKQWKKDFLV